jgi:hypothetical protein
MTKANEAPFSFYEHVGPKPGPPPPPQYPEFKASEVPEHTYDRLFEKMCYEESIARNERIARRAEALMAVSSLPPRMAMHEANRARSASPKRGQRAVSPTRFVSKEVPDFARLQAEFSE